MKLTKNSYNDVNNTCIFFHWYPINKTSGFYQVLTQDCFKFYISQLHKYYVILWNSSTKFKVFKKIGHLCFFFFSQIVKYEQKRIYVLEYLYIQYITYKKLKNIFSLNIEVALHENCTTSNNLRLRSKTHGYMTSAAVKLPTFSAPELLIKSSIERLKKSKTFANKGN